MTITFISFQSGRCANLQERWCQPDLAFFRILCLSLSGSPPFRIFIP